MDKALRTRLKQKQPIPQDVERIIKEEGVLTGSRVFGGYDKNTSDIDYIVPPSFSMSLIGMHLIYSHGDYTFDDYQSFYVRTENEEIINILFMLKQEQFEIWKEATFAMRRLVTRHPMIAEALQRKTARVALFETFKAILAPRWEKDFPSAAMELSNAITKSPIDDDDVPF